MSGLQSLCGDWVSFNVWIYVFWMNNFMFWSSSQVVFKTTRLVRDSDGSGRWYHLWIVGISSQFLATGDTLYYRWEVPHVWATSINSNSVRVYVGKNSWWCKAAGKWPQLKAVVLSWTFRPLGQVESSISSSAVFPTATCPQKISFLHKSKLFDRQLSIFLRRSVRSNSSIWSFVVCTFCTFCT